MKKPLLVAVPLVAAAVAIAFVVFGPGTEASDGLSASGTVEATEADLGFQVPGRIEEIVLREGDPVSGGEVVAYLDATEIRAVRDAAVAQERTATARLRELERGARPEELAQAESALASARARADEARREAERARTLFEGGAVSRQALDRAETALATAEAAARQAGDQAALVRQGPRTETLDAQRAMVEQARAQVARADAGLGFTRLQAPFPGVVSLRHREPGEVVQPGAPVLSVLDPADRWVRIYVPEDRLGRVRIGMPARIVADTWPDRVYEGEVVYIGSQAEFTPRNVQTAEERTKLVYPVKVRITGDPGFELKPGVPADVTLVEDRG
ncbi:MAG: HlyD family efflux transporter periplasmic adaptor subunit [Longimicrobiales bacterium]